LVYESKAQKHGLSTGYPAVLLPIYVYTRFSQRLFFDLVDGLDSNPAAPLISDVFVWRDLTDAVV
jgi:hypothetical protein